MINSWLEKNTLFLDEKKIPKNTNFFKEYK